VVPPGNAEHGHTFCAAEWSLTCQRNGAPVNLSGKVHLQTTHDRAHLGDEAPTVQMSFAVRRATDLERQVAEYLSHRNRQKAREIKAQQIALLEEALQAGQRQESSSGGVAKELELLAVVLERARQVAARLEDDEEDEELMARQCWQDRDDFSCASVCDLRQRDNSSAGSDGVADLRDFANFSPASSPPGSPRCLSPPSSRSNSAERAIAPQSQTSQPKPHAQTRRTNCFAGAFSLMLPRNQMFRNSTQCSRT